MEGYQWGGGLGRMGEKVQGIRSIIGRHKPNRGRVRGWEEKGGKGTGNKKHQW